MVVQLKVNKWELIASICRESFVEFVKRAWQYVPGAGKLQWGWHLNVFAIELQNIAERVFKGLPKLYDLVLNVAPGTSKSTIWSILFPAWVWTRMPSARIMTGSHTDTLATDLASKSREVMRSEWYRKCFPEIKFRKDQDTKHYFSNTLGGDRFSCTVGGKAPMGFHALFCIIDDPIDPQKTASEVELDEASKFMTEVIPTRKTDKLISVTMLVMQRLHYKDPTNAMLEQAKKEGADPVRHICLPAELTDDLTPADETYEIDGHTKSLREMYGEGGGLMDSQRLSEQALKPYKARGAFYYACQFLQKAVPPGGGMFKEQYFNKRVKASPHNAVRVWFWDRACLTPGTMILTKEGEKPIEFIEVGDLVYTRKGWKRVKWAGPTKITNDLVSVKFPNGRIVRGTKDHKIWTENNGWVELATISSSHYTVCISNERRDTCESTNSKQEPKLLYLKGSSIIEKDPNVIMRQCCGLMVSKYMRTCIELCGNIIRGIFQKDTIYTILMKIWKTTQSKILNVYPDQNITKDTTHSKNGIKPRKLWNIISELLNWFGKKLNIRNTSVANASSILNLEESMKSHYFVLDYVGKDSDTVIMEENVHGVTIHSLENQMQHVALNYVTSCSGTQIAPYVESSLKSKCEVKSVAPNHVREDYLEKTVVYDLEVEDAHEFFANGVLVHNSTEDGGCYSAGVLMAMTRDPLAFYIEHVVHGQWEPVERNQRMRAAAIKTRSRYGPKNEPRVLVEREGGSSGRDAWLMVARALVGFVCEEIEVTGAKDTRAEAWAAQLAAGNVWIVDNGEQEGTGKAEWDIEGYVKEHVLFRPTIGKRLGKFKDQVDASTGAFNYLIGAPVNLGFRHLPSMRKRGQLRIIVVDRNGLKDLLMEEEKVLLINLTDPMIDDRPGHAITNLLDRLQLPCADIQPSEYQDKWKDVVAPYGKLPEELIMPNDYGKKVWSFLKRKRVDNPNNIIIQDEGDRRALSTAMAICDCYMLKREEAIYIVNEPDRHIKEKELAPNQHVYDIVKLGRNAVI